MRKYTSLNNHFQKTNQLISDNGDIKFNNQKTNINGKNKTKSSQKWLHRQLNDPFTNAAKIEGYLARSAYKLLEIQHKYHIITKQSKIVIDLGCSPGSWSQVILTNEKLAHINIIGVDLLPIKFHHNNLTYVQGDFEDSKIQQQIVQFLQRLDDKKKQIQADCIICDIAANATGNSEIDRIRSERIIEAVIAFSTKHLVHKGNLVCKAIKGADNAVFKTMKEMFTNVYRFKPKSSRADSSELFLIGLYKKPRSYHSTHESAL